MNIVRIGSGAGYSGDRIEPAVELVEKGAIQYLVFECLAERTIAIALQNKRRDPSKGYDPLFEERMRAVLPSAVKNKVKIITNMGAANPVSAAQKACEIAKSLGLADFKIAAVTGDDVLGPVKGGNYRITESGKPVSSLSDKLISANAYLGVAPIVEALAGGADIVITGRVADPSLFLAPLVYEFGWRMDDWDVLGKGTLVGHLLECAGQLTGGYYADPGAKDVPNMAHLGFPIAEVAEDGSAIVTKVDGSGGTVTCDTCKEQLLYEIHDPTRYFTPDVVADFSRVAMTQVGADRVSISGATGNPRPENLKVTLGYMDGYIGDGQITYAGSNALARARLASEIVAARLKLTDVKTSELRFDIIGVNSISPIGPRERCDTEREVRLRVAGRTQSRREALRIGNEVETLYTNGPAGGGGCVKSAREVVAVLSTLLPREEVHSSVRYFEVCHEAA